MSSVNRSVLLPLLFVVVFAASRIPGLLPCNFSAAYGLALCAGAFLPGRMAWWLPLGVMAVTDVGLNIYYHSTNFTFLLANYAVYVFLILLGRRLTSKAPFLGLLGCGILGALLFYMVTNTVSWLLNPFNNPEYTKTLAGWFIALTKGTAGYPQTWEFFRNTLISGGLFTGLFAAAARWSESAREAEEPEEEPEAGSEGEEAPADEAGAKA
jgi:hypothetical protein